MQEQQWSDGWRQQIQQWSVPASAWGLLWLETELAFKSANTCLASDIGQWLRPWLYQTRYLAFCERIVLLWHWHSFLLVEKILWSWSCSNSHPQKKWNEIILAPIFSSFFLFFLRNLSKLYRSYYLHWLRELVSPVCGIFSVALALLCT